MKPTLVRSLLEGLILILFGAAFALLWWRADLRTERVHINQVPAAAESSNQASQRLLLDLELSTLERVELRTHICLATQDNESAADFTQRLAAIEIHWHSADERLQTWHFDELEQAPQRGDERCAIFPAFAPQAQSLELTMTGDIGPVDLMVTESQKVENLEVLACLMLLLAGLLKVLSWRLRDPGSPGAWRPYDPILAILTLILALTAMGKLIGREKSPVVQFMLGDSGLEGSHTLAGLGQGTLLALIGSVVVYVGVVLTFGLMRRHGRAEPLQLNSAKAQVLAPLAAGVALAVAASALLMSLTPDEPSPMQAVMSLPSTMIATAAIASLSPWYEELFFRGLLFGSLERGLNSKLAFILVAAAFLAVHVPQHIGFLVPLVPIAAVSLATSWLRWRQHAVAPAFALHLGYNAMLVVPSLIYGAWG